MINVGRQLTYTGLENVWFMGNLVNVLIIYDLLWLVYEMELNVISLALYFHHIKRHLSFFYNYSHIKYCYPRFIVRKWTFGLMLTNIARISLLRQIKLSAYTSPCVRCL